MPFAERVTKHQTESEQQKVELENQARQVETDLFNKDDQESQRRDYLLRLAQELLVKDPHYHQMLEVNKNPEVVDALRYIWNCLDIHTLERGNFFRKDKKISVHPTIIQSVPQVKSSDWGIQIERRYDSTDSRFRTDPGKPCIELMHKYIDIHEVSDDYALHVLKQELQIGGRVGWRADSSMVNGTVTQYVRGGTLWGDGLSTTHTDAGSKYLRCRELNLISYYSLQDNQLKFAIESNFFNRTGFINLDAALDGLASVTDKMKQDSIFEESEREQILWYLRDEPRFI